MFRITFFVDDKQLGEAFKRLAGVARNLEHVYVPNLASKGNGAVKATAADAKEMFITELRKHEEITPTTCKEALTSIGLRTGSYSKYLRDAVATGAVKRKKVGKSFAYEWGAK